jgi:hypothetical protein
MGLIVDKKMKPEELAKLAKTIGTRKCKFEAAATAGHLKRLRMYYPYTAYQKKNKDLGLPEDTVLINIDGVMQPDPAALAALANPNTDEQE